MRDSFNINLILLNFCEGKIKNIHFYVQRVCYPFVFENPLIKEWLANACCTVSIS